MRNKAEKVYVQKFEVTGKGRFPLDMLRYDSCCPDREEPLHPDLAPFVVKGPLGPMLKHPLKYELSCVPELYAFINLTFEKKKQALDEYKAQKNWAQIVWLHERPYRLEAFGRIVEHLSDEQYWQLLSEIYTDSENIWQNRQDWNRFLSSKRKHSELFMSESERAFLKSLPEQVTVYRGYVHGKNKRSISHTLSKETAAWFAQRYGSKKGSVLTLTVHRSRIFAYKNVRNEQEVLIP